MKALESRFNYGLLIAIAAICAYGAYQSREFQDVSRWFPMFAGVLGSGLAILALIVDSTGQVRRSRTAPASPEASHGAAHAGSHGAQGGAEPHIPTSGSDAIGEVLTGTLPSDQDEDEDLTPSEVLMGFAHQFAWFIGFAVLFVLFSILIAVPVWLTVFIRVVSKESWVRALISAVAMTAFLFLMCAFLGLALPEGAVFDSSAYIPIWRL